MLLRGGSRRPVREDLCGIRRGSGGVRGVVPAERRGERPRDCSGLHSRQLDRHLRRFRPGQECGGRNGLIDFPRGAGCCSLGQSPRIRQGLAWRDDGKRSQHGLGVHRRECREDRDEDEDHVHSAMVLQLKRAGWAFCWDYSRVHRMMKSESVRSCFLRRTTCWMKYRRNTGVSPLALLDRDDGFFGVIGWFEFQ